MSINRKLTAVSLSVAALAGGFFYGGTASATDDTPDPASALVSSTRLDAVERATPSQAATLADGTVTAEEYLAASAATLSCIEQAVPGDVVTEGPWLSKDGFQASYTFGMERSGREYAEPSDQDPLLVAERNCRAEHLESVETIYRADFLTSERMLDATISFEQCAESSLDQNARTEVSPRDLLASEVAQAPDGPIVSCATDHPALFFSFS